jgi:hypothetical protein
MAKDKTPLSLRCESAANSGKSFSVQEENERHTVSAETAKEVLEFRKKLTPQAKVLLDKTSVKNQLEIVKANALFTTEEDGN